MLLTEAEVAEKLRCSRSKVKRLRKQGLLGYLVGRPILIPEEDLAAYIRNHKRVALAERAMSPASADTASKDSLRVAAELARKIWLRRQKGRSGDES